MTSYFIALTFAPNVKKCDLTSAVQDFVYKVNAWEGRVEGMELTIEALKRDQLPSFVTSAQKKKRVRKSRGRKGGNKTEESENVNSESLVDEEGDIGSGSNTGEGIVEDGDSAHGDGSIIQVEEEVEEDTQGDVKITFGSLPIDSPSPTKKSKAVESMPLQFQSPTKKIRHLE